MRTLMLVLPVTFLTLCCWGVYGPILHEGQHAMGGSSLRPFICVGLAYFVIAVAAPLAALQTRGEKGNWTMSGAAWALIAGLCGAVGALGITLAFKSKGSPVYVMPLVFGGAPVVNTFVTMWMSRTFRQAGPVFFFGVAFVAAGAAGVMFFKPGAQGVDIGDLTINQLTNISLSIALTAVCWGSYGAMLHKGQAKMGGSRLRPLVCVGLAYFLVAVIAPSFVMGSGLYVEPGSWSLDGAFWSLGAGAAGAVGALGVILSFSLGGKPVFVMPLIFGGAPVVSTFVSIFRDQSFAQVSAPFIGSLLLVILGAVTVLIFAPRGKPPQAEPKNPAGDAADAT